MPIVPNQGCLLRLYVSALRNERNERRRRIAAAGPWQRACNTTPSGRNLGKETEAEKKTEEENHLASQRPAPAERITITGAQREAEREKRRGGREILLWRGRQAGRQAGESALTE